MGNEQIIKEAIGMLRDEGYTVIDPNEDEEVTPQAPETETPYSYPEYVDNTFSVIE